METATMQIMNELLSMFSEKELQFLTTQYKEVFDNGFGSVTVNINNGHPDLVTPAISKKFPKPPKDYSAE